MSRRAIILLVLAAAGLPGLDCRGKENTNLAPSSEEMDAQRRDEQRQELEHDVGEAARDEDLHKELQQEPQR